MVKARGVNDGKGIRLLEKVDLPEMSEVEVYFKPIEKSPKSLKDQLETMKKGFDMGKILVSFREELHER